MSNHLHALQVRLSNERVRLANARTEGERELRRVWIAQVEKEITIEQSTVFCDTISDDELLAALEA